MSQVGAGALVGQQLGKYELLALLAVGGTAEIYLARIGGEAGFEKYVVVKCLLDHLADDPEFVRMFLDEARLGAQLDHSNIVQTLELGEQDGRYYMAMEYLAGMSLAQLARKTHERVPGGTMPIQLILGLAAQACAGLHYAHRKQASDGVPLNLIHRDISPQNLVVSFDGVLKIVDFGIAKADVRDTHTRSGTIKGKFAYMSPEQCLAQEIDYRTDIFALGVICHELLTARRLFKRSTTYETYETIINGKVPRPSELNPQLDRDLDDVVMKALSYDKKDRYESAEDFGQALRSALHKRGMSVSASDVATYYEKYFEQELEEHATRMRQLITGERRRAEGETLNWDAAEIIESGEGEESQSEHELDAADLEEISPEEAEPPDPAATRVELNPLEKARRAHGRPAARPARPTRDLSAPSIEPLLAHDTDDLSGLAPNEREADAPPGKGGGQRTIAPGGVAPVGQGTPAPTGRQDQPKRTMLGVSPFDKPGGAPGPSPAAGGSRPGLEPEGSVPAGARTGPDADTLYQGPPAASSETSGQVPVPPDTLPPVGSGSSGPSGPGTEPRPGAPGLSGPHGQPRPMGPPPRDPSLTGPLPGGSTEVEPVGPPVWVLGVLFAVSLGIGLGVTLLIGM